MSGPAENLRRTLSTVLARAEQTAAWQLLTIFRRIDGRDRIMMLAGQAFLAMFPVLIVVASFGSSGGQSVADRLIAEFDLAGSSAEAMRLLFRRPPDGTHGVTLISLVVLLWTFSSFARAMQRTFEAAWELPRRGMRGAAPSAAGVVTFFAVPSLAGWLGSLWAEGVIGVAVAVVVQTGAVVAGWALVSWFMLSRRLPFSTMLPGAVATSVVQMLIGWCSAIYVPIAIAHNSSRYGVIGVAMALISWMLIVSAGIVFSAAAGPVAHDWWTHRRGILPTGRGRPAPPDSSTLQQGASK